MTLSELLPGIYFSLMMVGILLTIGYSIGAACYKTDMVYFTAYNKQRNATWCAISALFWGGVFVMSIWPKG